MINQAEEAISQNLLTPCIIGFNTVFSENSPHYKNRQLKKRKMERLFKGLKDFLYYTFKNILKYQVWNTGQVTNGYGESRNDCRVCF